MGRDLESLDLSSAEIAIEDSVLHISFILISEETFARFSQSFVAFAVWQRLLSQFCVAGERVSASISVLTYISVRITERLNPYFRASKSFLKVRMRVSDLRIDI